MADVIWKIERRGRYIREISGRGQIRIMDETTNPVCLGFLYVKNGAKRKGLGRALLKFALDEFGAIQAGATPRRFPGSIEAKPEHLTAFYESLGVRWVNPENRNGQWTLKLEDWKDD